MPRPTLLYRADRIFLNEEQKKEKEEGISYWRQNIQPSLRQSPRKSRRTLLQLIKTGQRKPKSNRKYDIVFEEDDPEALVECTREEWELSINRCDIKVEDGTTTKALLKKEEVSDKKSSVFLLLNPIQEEGKEKCIGKHHDMQATEPLPESKHIRGNWQNRTLTYSIDKENESIDDVICVEDENASSESKINMDNASIGEEDEEGSTQTTNAPSERSRDAWILHV